MNNSYQIKEEPEDFIVDEILNNGTFASNPTPINSNEEEGKIYWVCLKKRMWNTIDLTKEIAKRLRTNEKYINYAGIKDRVAVTYQCFSINSERENLIERINNIKDVEVTGFWKLHFDADDIDCNCRVEYRWVTWYWHDHGDLHGNVGTQLDNGEVVADSEFDDVGMGKSFPIKISWTDDKAEWRARWWSLKHGGYARVEEDIDYISGWPAPAKASPSGSGGRE